MVRRLASVANQMSWKQSFRGVFAKNAIPTCALDAKGGPNRGVGAFALAKPTTEAGLRALPHRRW